MRQINQSIPIHLSTPLLERGAPVYLPQKCCGRGKFLPRFAGVFKTLDPKDAKALLDGLHA